MAGSLVSEEDEFGYHDEEDRRDSFGTSRDPMLLFHKPVSPHDLQERQRYLTFLGIVGVAFIIAGIAGAFGVVHTGFGVRPSGVKNVIFFIADGCGPVCIAALRQYNDNHPLNIDAIYAGQSQTSSASSLVTDSAAGATAYSCAQRTANLRIGTDARGRSCVTVLEAAGLSGMKTGVVTTTRVTHATPASFTAHVLNRDSESDIAEWQVAQPHLNLIMGGGEEYYRPSSQGGARTDAKDLVNEAVDKYGWHHLSPAHDLRTRPISDTGAERVLALYASSHMPYEIDRSSSAGYHIPTLSEMTAASLDYLHSISDHNGFFIMIEGGRLDHALHSNDPGSFLREAQMYDNAIGVAIEFARTHPGTMIVATADHDTGGMAIGGTYTNPITHHSDYTWRPDVLRSQFMSTDSMLDLLTRAGAPTDLNSLYLRGTTIDLSLPEHSKHRAEIDEAVTAYKSSKSSADRYAALNALSAPLLEAAMVKMTTNGHTGVDVNLYASGPSTEYLHGSHPNFHVGQHVVNVLDLEQWKLRFTETEFWKQHHLA